jgi:hypothetical protein
MAYVEIEFLQHRIYNATPYKTGDRIKVTEGIARALTEVGAAKIVESDEKAAYNPVEETKPLKVEETKEAAAKEEKPKKGSKRGRGKKEGDE